MITDCNDRVFNTRNVTLMCHFQPSYRINDLEGDHVVPMCIVFEMILVALPECNFVLEAIAALVLKLDASWANLASRTLFFSTNSLFRFVHELNELAHGRNDFHLLVNKACALQQP